MKIEKLYLTLWFQRTSIHLREIFDFIKNRRKFAHLDQRKLERFREKLCVKKVLYYEKSNLDMLEILCKDINIMITEDGLIFLSLKVKNYKKDWQKLEDFYDNSFGPAISYLFSAGAPLPKDIVHSEKIHPIFLVAKDISERKIKALLKQRNDDLISFSKGRGIQVFFGDQLIILNVEDQKKFRKADLEDVLGNLVFFREFEKQLGHYLRLHRSMWDKISKIRESKSIRYHDFPNVRQKIMEYIKILSFVKARLAQMHDILIAREKSVALANSEVLIALNLYRFDHLEASQKYVSDLWQMTFDYVEGTLKILEHLYEENTQRELGTLKFITLVGAIAGFFGMNIAFPWEERWPNVFLSSLVVFVLILVTSLIFYVFLRLTIHNRKFQIKKEVIKNN